MRTALRPFAFPSVLVITFTGMCTHSSRLMIGRLLFSHASLFAVAVVVQYFDVWWSSVIKRKTGLFSWQMVVDQHALTYEKCWWKISIRTNNATPASQYMEQIKKKQQPTAMNVHFQAKCGHCTPSLCRVVADIIIWIKNSQRLSRNAQIFTHKHRCVKRTIIEINSHSRHKDVDNGLGF